MLAVGDVRPHFTPPYPQTFGTTPQQTTQRVLLLLNSTLLTFGHTSTPACCTNPPRYQANLKHIMIPAATVTLQNLDGAFSMPNKATKIPLVSETPWCVWSGEKVQLLGPVGSLTSLRGRLLACCTCSHYRCYWHIISSTKLQKTHTKLQRRKVQCRKMQQIKTNKKKYAKRDNFKGFTFYWWGVIITLWYRGE